MYDRKYGQLIQRRQEIQELLERHHTAMSNSEWLYQPWLRWYPRRQTFLTVRKRMKSVNL
jgi:hypothetical protein